MDILEQLRRPLTYTQIDGVTVVGHPCGPLDDVIEEAAAEIDKLRTALHEIAANEYSGYGGIGGIARSALKE